MRKWISSRISRGHITLRLTITYEDKSPIHVIPNIPLAKQIHQAYLLICQELNLEAKNGSNLSLIAKNEDILCFQTTMEDENAYRDLIKEAFDQACDQLIRMKEEEGKALLDDIEQRLVKLAEWIEEIESKSKNSVNKFREKLTHRLNEFFTSHVENEEKVLREVCVYAEKLDIAEELTRFKSHLKQIQSILRSKDHVVGKSLEFLLQEFGREINTIGSKSADIAISHKVVDIKTELEKIREQIQNVE